MADPIRTLVVLDTGLGAEQIEGSLPSVSSDVAVISVVEGIDAGVRALGETHCSMLVVACRGYSERVLYFVENNVKQHPERPVLVLADEPPAGFIRRLFDAGADDILPFPPAREEFVFGIQKALARRESGTSRSLSAQQARLIVVLGPKGGTGKTLTATNLATAMQEAGQKVAIVDLDLQFGDVALCMGLAPDKTMYDLAIAPGPVDLEKVEKHLLTHRSGVKVLVAPARPDQASAISTGLVREIYSILRADYDAIVVDTPPGFTAEVIATIDMSSDLVMVGMLDSLSLKNTKLGLETLELMGYTSDTIRIVLNRAQTKVGIPPEAVAMVLGRAPEVLVPSDREIPVAINNGTPIVEALPQSEAAAAFRLLATHYYRNGDSADHADEAAPASTTTERKRRSLLRRGR